MSDNIKFQVIENEENIFKIDPSFKVADTAKNTFQDQNVYNQPNKLTPNNISSMEMNKSTTFEEQIKNYFDKNKVKLYILTPCFGSMCYVNYVHCLMSTIELFRKLDIQLKIEFCKNDSLVSRARNNLIARAMTDKDATHFMFIDNDITWNPVDILKCMVSNQINPTFIIHLILTFQMLLKARQEIRFY
jgi:hypothetical protein